MAKNVTSVVKSILEPGNKNHPKLNCLDPDLSRYNHLKPVHSPHQTKYFFALNLKQNVEVLPRLLGSVIEVIKFLGPENCALSVVEGNSNDGTGEVLTALRHRLDKRIKTHFLLSVDIDPIDGNGSRYAKLAQLRNLALQPMLYEPERYMNATIIFLNDVAICPDDILELVHQRVVLGADMTCAVDWTFNPPPVFYDIFISRGMNGDIFFDIPPDTSWGRATYLFWNDPETKARFDAKKPIQVFACWNGAAIFTAEPIVTRKIAFRGSREDLGECVKGEPELLCKDFWFHGYGKIAVVPTVNLEYSNDAAHQIKLAKGYTSHSVKPASEEYMIQWKPPPDQVKCMPTFGEQSWVPWNQTLV